MPLGDHPEGGTTSTAGDGLAPFTSAGALPDVFPSVVHAAKRDQRQAHAAARFMMTLRSE